MIEVAIMIEGQNGLNWPRWMRIAKAVEELGFIGLYRSDHFTNANPPDLDSLELWVSLTWLATRTRRIEFGPLVTPVSFRHPTLTARMASAVDDLSRGRMTLGLGAGWQDREHHNFGFDLLEVPERFKRFEEGLEVITLLLGEDQPVTFSGKYFQLNEAVMLPRPARYGGPPILIGGNGQRRTLPLAARYGNEWNGVFLPANKFVQLNQHLDQLLIKAGRSKSDVRRSLMTGCVIGSQDAEVVEKVKKRTNGKRTLEDLRKRGLVVGTPGQIQEQLEILAEAGVQRIMLQWLDLDDLEGLSVLAKATLE